MRASSRTIADVDLVVVGAGIVGLAHALAAHRRGLKVAVVERSAWAMGASVRNFGHLCITPQSGDALTHALRSRELWLELAEEVGLWIREHGTTVVARNRDELAVLEEFADERGSAQVLMLGRVQVLERTPVRDSRLVGGAWLSLDLQIDPREAMPRIASWLRAQGVAFHWQTTVLGLEPGAVHTSKGTITTAATVVAVGHEFGAFAPRLAQQVGLLSCSLDMLGARAPWAAGLETPLLTGWSLSRYSGLAAQPSAGRLHARLVDEFPHLAEVDLNQMYTQRPDGMLVLGDTHFRDLEASPFQAESAFEMLLSESKTLFGVRDIHVTERWQGVYASADREIIVHALSSHARLVTIATGIGMTTALGLAEEVVGDLFASVHVGARPTSAS